jgi:hypothetical protein
LLKRRSKLAQFFTIVATAGPTIADFVRGLWKGDRRNRFLVPLVVFLCTMGLILVLGASAEAVAPFIYSIF